VCYFRHCAVTIRGMVLSMPSHSSEEQTLCQTFKRFKCPHAPIVFGVQKIPPWKKIPTSCWRSPKKLWDSKVFAGKTPEWRGKVFCLQGGQYDIRLSERKRAVKNIEQITVPPTRIGKDRLSHFTAQNHSKSPSKISV
jgi:hypothetical protein